MTSKKTGKKTGSEPGPKIFVALGANIPSAAGPPEMTLKAALVALARSGIQILGVSAFYKTAAWPDPGDPPFVNAVAALETDLQPFALLGLLHEVETAYGRKRSAKNAPRSLDLDLLDYRGRVEEGPPILPHPRLAERRFVLEPLRDVAPGWRHPQTGRTVEELLAGLPSGLP
jgi:2-amino-4-hydroxy-6-hydroxymethyldihydropteridine diphosphokinase